MDGDNVPLPAVMMKVPLFLLCLFAAVGPIWGQASNAGQSAVMLAPELKEAILKRSLVAPGDAAPLSRVFAKAERGEKLVVGVIGGSITQGAKATKPEKRYPNVMAQWWRDQYPKTEVTLVNAGIGATGSNYGALRVQRDLLSKNPDFVIVEYSCNDPDVQQSAVTLEAWCARFSRPPERRRW
jgi:hypothetical protein